MSLPCSCVLALCGLPGSGKSTLARRLKESGDERGENVVWIRFDDDLEESNAIDQSTGNFDVECWHESRFSSLKRIRDATQQERQIIIADDNAQYRSMRHTIFKIARDHSCAFACICIDLPLQEAMQRNANRPANECVPVTGIQRIFTQLEVPDGEKHSWERFSLRVRDDYSIDEIWNLIKKARTAGPPPRPPTEDEAIALRLKREQAQAETAASAAHAIDLALRRLVGYVIKALVKDLDKNQKATLAFALAQARTFVQNARYSDLPSAILAFEEAVQKELLSSSFPSDRITSVLSTLQVLVGRHLW